MIGMSLKFSKRFKKMFVEGKEASLKFNWVSYFLAIMCISEAC